MRKKNWHSFVVSHQLVNRVYDMLDYFNFFENRAESEQVLKKKINSKMNNITILKTWLVTLKENLKDIIKMLK